LPGEKRPAASVLIKDGLIDDIFPASKDRADIVADIVMDLSGRTLYPGFIDIHIHGAVGVDVMAADIEGLSRMAGFLAQKGITRWMPTFVPDAEENYARAIDALEKFINWQEDKPVSQVAGVHYEGPFVSEKQCGALHERYFRTFENEASLSSLPTLASDNAKHLMTVAPEVPGGIHLINKLRAAGWIVSLGHTRADARTLDAALEAGARHMTHFFNAMSGLHHRDLGAVGWGLANDKVTCDVIADGVHVHPLMLKLLHQTKTAGRLSLISDAVLPTGIGDGEYEVWGEKIKVENGRTSNERGAIAGSVTTMLDAVKMMLSLGVPEHEAALMASTNPARLLGIGSEYGSIEAGKRADLVALDENGEAVLTVIGGQIVR
jgi:N-acetylglucosamine-6-phosphate deacetylase